MNRPIFVNTRPIERGRSLTWQLQQANMHVVDLPLLKTVDLAITPQERLYMQRWLAGYYQTTIVVSQAAAKLAVNFINQLKILDKQRSIYGFDKLAPNNFCASLNIDTNVVFTHCMRHLSSFIAVGKSTAQLLQSVGWQVQTPKQQNNEGMLNLPILKKLTTNNKVLIWRGVGGRRLLENALKNRGVQVDAIEWYERIFPPASIQCYQLLIKNVFTPKFAQFLNDEKPCSPPIWVLISSKTAFGFWQNLVKSHNTNQFNGIDLSAFNYVVLGERLANLLHRHELTYKQVEDLTADTIYQAIKSE